MTLWERKNYIDSKEKNQQFVELQGGGWTGGDMYRWSTGAI